MCENEYSALFKGKYFDSHLKVIYVIISNFRWLHFQKDNCELLIDFYTFFHLLLGKSKKIGYVYIFYS